VTPFEPYGPRLGSGVIQALMALIPLIYMAHALAPADLGFLGLTLAGATLAQYLVALRAESRVGHHGDSNAARQDRASVLGLALIGLLAALLVGLAGARLWPAFAEVFVLAPALAAVRFVGALELAGVTDEKRIARHTVLNTVGGLIGLSLTIGLISGLGLGWQGRVLALVLTEGGITLARAAWLERKGQGHRLAWSPMRAAVLIGGALPSLTTSVLGWLLANVDRLVALFMLSMTEVGYFVIAYRVGLGIATINRSLAFALAPRVHAVLERGPRDLMRLHARYGGAILALAVALGAIAYLWTDVIFGADFRPAGPIVALVALGYGLQGLQRVAGIVKTKLGLRAPDPRHVALGVALQLALAVGLVPVLGALGPACGTVAGLTVIALLSIAGAYRALGDSA
jgi:O-antigen/teichoic acid export membrane protein